MLYSTSQHLDLFCPFFSILSILDQCLGQEETSMPLTSHMCVLCPIICTSSFCSVNMGAAAWVRKGWGGFLDAEPFLPLSHPWSTYSLQFAEYSWGCATSEAHISCDHHAVCFVHFPTPCKCQVHSLCAVFSVVSVHNDLCTLCIMNCARHRGKG